MNCQPKHDPTIEGQTCRQRHYSITPEHGRTESEILNIVIYTVCKHSYFFIDEKLYGHSYLATIIMTVTIITGAFLFGNFVRQTLN